MAGDFPARPGGPALRADGAGVVVDSLAHVTADGTWFQTGLDASLGALVKAMDADGVDKAVLAGIPRAGDDEVLLSACREHPGRFLPVAGLDTSLAPRDMEARLERVANAGFLGVKIHPRLCGTPVGSPAVAEAVRLAGRAGLAALVCTVHRAPLPALGRPLWDALYELCAGAPNTRIVLVHGGYFDLLATSEAVRPMEHVLLDLSLTAVRFGAASIGLDVRYLLDTFDRRVCIGTDFPESRWADVRRTLDLLGRDGGFRGLDGVCGANVLGFLGDMKEGGL